MSVDYELIGRRIKAARKEKGLTQEQLAEALEVSVGYVSQVERGKTKISLQLLGKIAGVTKKDLAYFVGGVSASVEDGRRSGVPAGFEKLSFREQRLVELLIRGMLDPDAAEANPRF